MLPMLHWFRVRASRIAAVAVVALAAAVSSSAAPHEDDCHDAACSVVPHDASAHRLVAPAGPGDEPIHCLVCHWARSFRPRTEARILPTPAAEPGITVHFEYFTAAVNAPVAQPPLRSPPSPALS
jgi:hypothetical protein